MLLKRVHLGSGDKYMPGWVNVDLYAERADVREDLATVQFPASSVSRALCVHVIEHLSFEVGVDLLKRIHRWMAPQGYLRLETPCCERCVQLFDTALGEHRRLMGGKGLVGGRSCSKKEWHDWILGHEDADGLINAKVPEKWRLPGEEHVYVWHERELLGGLIDAGFSHVAVVPPKFHGKQVFRDMAFLATR